LVSREYLLTVPSSEPVMKKSFCAAYQPRAPRWRGCSAYASHNRRIVLLTVVQSDRLIVRSSGEYAAVIVDTSCDELLSVRRVGQVGCAGGI
jgi:hypothetical protein